jgi:hypothetical protein
MDNTDSREDILLRKDTHHKGMVRLRATHLRATEATRLRRLRATLRLDILL